METSTRTAPDYKTAQKVMRENPGVPYQWDAGDGWIAEGYYDRKKKRVVSHCFNPATGGFCN